MIWDKFVRFRLFNNYMLYLPSSIPVAGGLLDDTKMILPRFEPMIMLHD